MSLILFMAIVSFVFFHSFAVYPPYIPFRFILLHIILCCFVSLRFISFHFNFSIMCSYLSCIAFISFISFHCSTVESFNCSISICFCTIGEAIQHNQERKLLHSWPGCLKPNLKWFFCRVIWGKEEASVPISSREVVVPLLNF